eukprot:154051-Pyramimonas_sp.AAC.1
MAVNKAFASGSRLELLGLCKVLIASETSIPFSIPLALYPLCCCFPELCLVVGDNGVDDGGRILISSF